MHLFNDQGGGGRGCFLASGEPLEGTGSPRIDARDRVERITDIAPLREQHAGTTGFRCIDLEPHGKCEAADGRQLCDFAKRGTIATGIIQPNGSAIGKTRLTQGETSSIGALIGSPKVVA